MRRASKCFCSGVLFLTTFHFLGAQISPRLQKKINTAITTTYGVAAFELREVSTELEELSLDGDSLFEIVQDTEQLGYLYLGEAPSMKQVFDYIVMFDPDITIKKSKVLIYREDYGQQIGSQRWLKQFIGLSVTDVPMYSENIDAIAGATISAKNMTDAVGNVLKKMGVLKEKQVLP